MADVILAEVDGQAWLVVGEQYVDDVLAGTLPPDVTVEIVPCATRVEAWAMWQKSPEDELVDTHPWAIHPAIVRRIKGEMAECRIRFTPWSAMLNDDAHDVIAAVAAWLAAHPHGRATLLQLRPGEAPPGLADLQSLRGQLVVGALARAGADTGRLDHEIRPSETPEDLEQMDIVTAIPSVATDA